MEILKFSEPPKRNRRSGSTKKSGLMPLVSFGIAVLVLGGMSTTLAGTITLNSSGSVEFGQGVVTTAACDTSIKVTPSTTYETSTSTFKVNQIVLSAIGVAVSDTSSATQIASGCLGKIFTVRAYDSNKAAMTFTTTGNPTSFQFKLMADTGTVVSGGQPTDVSTGFAAARTGNWTALTTTDENSSKDNTGIVTVTGFTLGADVDKITVETSK
jgi:hypothetical protein